MRRLIFLSAWVLLIAACAPSGREDYAGWSTYLGPSDIFSVRYLAPPWEICSDTEYEEDCRECSRHLLGAAVCGASSRSETLWIPPRLLDPEYLLIPPYKLEITWFSSEVSALDLAQSERNVMVRAGLEEVIEPRPVTLHDGTAAAEVGYRGPMHLVINDDPVDRPDEREFRVVYATGGGWAYRVAIDTAISIHDAEVRDMLASFTLDPAVPEEGD